jgi:glycosyltransferase involved in cell wall biosynthesis
MDLVMNSMSVNISVVVPVFNVEKYLLRCLNSIFSQKFSGTYEVIAVDDGSTDGSLQILKSYKAKEGRLKTIEHGVNKKLSIARRTGMDASIGEYIMHVDSDDWLLPDTFEHLFKKCIETGADVLVYNHISENNKGERTFIKRIKNEIITNDKLKVQRYFYGASWNKVVKRVLTKDLIYGAVAINTTEDLLYTTEILLKANRICLIPEIFYVYFANLESLSLAIKPDKLLEKQIDVLRNIRLITLKYGAESRFINNILNYLEKDIFLAVSQAAFLTKEKWDSNGLLNAFRLFPEMTEMQLNTLSLSISNRYYSLILVLFKFGPKPVIGIILRCIRKLYINNSKVQ